MVRQFSGNWSLYYPSIRTIQHNGVIRNLQILKGQIAGQFKKIESGITFYADRIKIKNPSSMLSDIDGLEVSLQQISDERELEIEEMNVRRLGEGISSVISSLEDFLRTNQNHDRHLEMLKLSITALRKTLDFLEGKIKGRRRVHDEIFDLIDRILKKLDEFKDYTSYKVLREYILKIYRALLEANTRLKDAEKGFSRGKKFIDKQADRRVKYIQAYSSSLESDKLRESIATTLKYLKEIDRVYF